MATKGCLHTAISPPRCCRTYAIAPRSVLITPRSDIDFGRTYWWPLPISQVFLHRRLACFCLSRLPATFINGLTFFVFVNETILWFCIPPVSYQGAPPPGPPGHPGRCIGVPVATASMMKIKKIPVDRLKKTHRVITCVETVSGDWVGSTQVYDVGKPVI